MRFDAMGLWVSCTCLLFRRFCLFFFVAVISCLGYLWRKAGDLYIPWWFCMDSIDLIWKTAQWHEGGPVPAEFMTFTSCCAFNCTCTK